MAFGARLFGGWRGVVSSCGYRIFYCYCFSSSRFSPDSGRTRRLEMFVSCSCQEVYHARTKALLHHLEKKKVGGDLSMEVARASRAYYLLA
jgi:hypothetical protein